MNGLIFLLTSLCYHRVPTIAYLNNLIINVTEQMEAYDLNKVTHLIQDFVCDELSNWYIRRNRRRFWGSKLDTSKKAVYKTTYDVLEGLCRLIAPVVPFVSDEIYTALTNEESVHLANYPEYNEVLKESTQVCSIQDSKEY